MFEKELSISEEAVRFLGAAGVLAETFTGEVIMDADVTEEGAPIVLIGADRVEYDRLVEIVPDKIDVQGRSVCLTLWCTEPRGLN